MQKFYRQLIIKWFVFLSIFLILVTGLIIFMPLDYNDYLLQNGLETKNELLSKTESPKIVLVGGSNLLFGIDSNLIAKSTGYNVLNMGFRHGFGLDYQLRQIPPADIHSGDIIILTPEYSLYNTLYSGKTKLIYRSLFLYPKGAETVSIKPHLSPPSLVQALSKIGPKYFMVNKPIPQQVWNQYGDKVDHFERDPVLSTTCPDVSAISLGSKAQNHLNIFAKQMRGRDAEIFITFPPILHHCYPGTKNYDTFYNALKEFTTIPLLGSPASYSFVESEYYESPYHLNQQGAQRRARLLIEDLQSYYQQK